MKKSAIYLLIVGTIFTFQCSEPIEDNPYTYSQLLTGEESKTWQLTDIFLIQESFESIEYNIFNPCFDDDEYVFYNNAQKLYEAKQGSSRCFEGDDVYLVDRWSIVNATSTITFPLTPLLLLPIELNDINLTIVSLRESRMILEFPYQDLTFRFILESN